MVVMYIFTSSTHKNLEMKDQSRSIKRSFKEIMRYFVIDQEFDRGIEVKNK